MIDLVDMRVVRVPTLPLDGIEWQWQEDDPDKGAFHIGKELAQ